MMSVMISPGISPAGAYATGGQHPHLCGPGGAVSAQCQTPGGAVNNRTHVLGQRCGPTKNRPLAPQILPMAVAACQPQSATRDLQASATRDGSRLSGAAEEYVGSRRGVRGEAGRDRAACRARQIPGWPDH